MWDGLWDSSSEILKYLDRLCNSAMIGGSHFRLPWAARDPLRREEKMAARSPLLNHPHNCSQKGRSTKACPQRTDDILGLGGLFEPSHQPRKNTGRRRDGRGDAVARRLAE